MAEQTVQVATGGAQATSGSAGLKTQVGGASTSVSAAAEATGGINPGNFVETDIDDELFKFNSDDTPLMQLMLRAKKVKATSPKVEHYMIDEAKSSVTTVKALEAGTTMQVVLPLGSEDQPVVHAYDTLRVRGVNGYSDAGIEQPGKDLMLWVVGKDTTTGNPVVRAVNGKKDSADDLYSKVPAIPSGTVIDLLGNAMYETQKVVPPSLVLPKPTIIQLQKRGMTQVVSDYFDAQKKRIPFTKAVVAEAMITDFKRKGNRTLWVSRSGHFVVDTEKVGTQDVYTTEGIRWQFKKELQHSGKWTYEQFVGLAKMFFTGEDVPNTCLGLCGKNFLENIQCIDFSKHPEVQISVQTNKLGWKVTNIHTVFGDIQFKREPTLDRLGYSNSAALLGENRLVHYVYRPESSSKENIEGEEASRESVIVWDGLGLKGTCHIWIDGEGEGANADSTTFVMWDSAEAPATTPDTKSPVYYLMQDCKGISPSATLGELWYYDGKAWTEYTGEILL